MYVQKVTAGKIHVEIERARLTMKLSKIKEADGDIAGAADVLHELQVETYVSLDLMLRYATLAPVRSISFHRRCRVAKLVCPLAMRCSLLPSVRADVCSAPLMSRRPQVWIHGQAREG